jgi:NADH-quinone oxidoreductase subunit K
MTPLHLCLVFSTLLFSLGLAAALSRGNAILVLLGIELMLNAANLNFIAFWRHSPQAAGNPHAGVVFVVFSIAVAAAEAAVGLALIIAVYRHQKNIRVQDAAQLKG